jgi:hypothetical protein
MTMFLVALITMIFVAGAVCLGIAPLRRRRMALELRRDWWPRFEREFREYAGRSWSAAREGERGL